MAKLADYYGVEIRKETGIVISLPTKIPENNFLNNSCNHNYREYFGGLGPIK